MGEAATVDPGGLSVWKSSPATDRPDNDIELAIVMPWVEWISWHAEYEKHPDLKLARPVDIKWHEPGVNTRRVDPGVERDGLLLYRTEPNRA